MRKLPGYARRACHAADAPFGKRRAVPCSGCGSREFLRCGARRHRAPPRPRRGVMTSTSPVAIVDASSASAPARLRLHDPGAHTASHRLPGVRSFSYHQLAGHDGQIARPAWDDTRVCRPVARSVRRLRSLARFLGTDRLRVGEGAFCEVIEPPSANVAVFAPWSFGRRQYHVMMSGGDSLPATVRDFAAVNVVTGSCLFSDRVVRLHGAGDGDTSFSCVTPSSAPIDAPVHRIESAWPLTLYEFESACRLPWLSADVIALLPPRLPVTVTIDVPRVQYYVYLLDAFQRGLIASKWMWRWFELVDERNARVSALLEREFAIALSEMLPGRFVGMRRAEGMAGLEPAIRRSVQTRSPLSVAALAAMLSTADAVWSTAIGGKTPSSYRELVNLSYAVEQLRGGIAEQHEHPRLGIAIDSPSERRAHSQARTIARDVSKDSASGLRASLLGLHPLERVFTSKATGPSDLYYNDPGRMFVDQAARYYGIAELLEAVYPGRPRPRRRASPDSRVGAGLLSNLPRIVEPAAAAATQIE